MPKERILSADSHVAIRDDAVLRHLPQIEEARLMIGGNAARVYRL